MPFSLTEINEAIASAARKGDSSMGLVEIYKMVYKMVYKINRMGEAQEKQADAILKIEDNLERIEDRLASLEAKVDRLL
jgi:DNA repair exonuclease SbcCD ATPase subunit